MSRSLIVRIHLGVLATAVCSLASLGIPASAAAAATPPVIESESVSHITQTDAVLEADISPGGLATHYQFHLAYGCGFEGEACPQYCIAGQPCPGPWNSVITVSLPSGDLPASTAIQHVSLDLNSVGVTLEPYKYRYSIEATNAEGTAKGTAQYFTPASSPPPPANSAPMIESESVSDITPTDATLEIQINPGGLQTTYEIWVGTLSCLEENLGATCESTEVTGTLPASSSTEEVSVDLAKAWHSLLPGTWYTFSARATNSDGKAYGNGQQFKTTGAPPAIEAESISHLTQTDATLEAQINTEGLETTYTFYLHEEGPPCLTAEPPCMVLEKAPIPLPSGKLLGSFVGQNVSADLNSAGVSLSPGVSYEYWVSATNAAGTTMGQPQSFTTPSESGVEPLNEPSGTSDPQSSTTNHLSSSSSIRPLHHRRHRHHRWRRRSQHRLGLAL